jgi:hypothetical protein
MAASGYQSPLGSASDNAPLHRGQHPAPIIFEQGEDLSSHLAVNVL